MTFISATVILFLVMDPLGGIPLFMTSLANVDPAKRPIVILRECGIAFLVLLLFLLFGERFMSVLQLSNTSMGMAGGIILFLIALRILFPIRGSGVFGDVPDGEPFIVPLAIPLIAGPSAIATVMLLASRYPLRLVEWVLALILATLVSTAILALGSRITRLLGKRGVSALERLMALVLTAIAVEMFLGGIRDFITHL